jgi:ATP-dependent protease ClpP protease subunit
MSDTLPNVSWESTSMLMENLQAVKDQSELERELLQDVDTWLSPDEAVKYGLADIVEPGGRDAW